MSAGGGRWEARCGGGHIHHHRRQPLQYRRPVAWSLPAQQPAALTHPVGPSVPPPSPATPGSPPPAPLASAPRTRVPHITAVNITRLNVPDITGVLDLRQRLPHPPGHLPGIVAIDQGAVIHPQGLGCRPPARRSSRFKKPPPGRRRSGPPTHAAIDPAPRRGPVSTRETVPPELAGVWPEFRGFPHSGQPTVKRRPGLLHQTGRRQDDGKGPASNGEPACQHCC